MRFRHHRFAVEVHETGGIRSTGPLPTVRPETPVAAPPPPPPLPPPPTEAPTGPAVDGDAMAVGAGVVDAALARGTGSNRALQAFEGEDVDEAAFFQALGAEPTAAPAPAAPAGPGGVAARQRGFNEWLAGQDPATQRTLAQKGVGRLDVDGKEGPKTRAALAARAEVEASRKQDALGGGLTAQASIGATPAPLAPPASAAEAFQRADALRNRGQAGKKTDQDTTIVRDVTDANQPLTADQRAKFTEQVAANGALEQAALAKLAPEQRAQYDRVARGMGDRPDARLSLQLLAIGGKLPGAATATNPAAFDQGYVDRAWNGAPRQDDLLTSLDKLADPAKAPIHPDIDRAALLGDVVNEVAYPDSINQHNRGSCSVTTAQILLADRNPAEYARVVAGLASPGGTVRMANGETLVREADTVTEDGSRRSISARLMQPALMEHANGALDYDNTMKNQAYYQKELDGWNQRKAWHEQNGKAFKEPMPQPTEDRHSDGTSGVGAAGMHRVMEGLFGDGKIRTVEAGATPDWADKIRNFRETYQNWQENNERVPNGQALTSEIERAANAGKPVSVGMMWGGRDADGRVHGAHQLVVTKVEADRVTLRNPWGREETMTRAEFEKRVFSAQIAE